MANTVKQGVSGQDIEQLGSLSVREGIRVWDGFEYVEVLSKDDQKTYTIEEVRQLGERLPGQLVTSDNGGGVWYLDESDITTVDNIGTVLVTSSDKRYKRVFNGYVNVFWFGAVGDSVTDDTAAFQACIDFCVSNPARPKTMWIPIAMGGKYLLTADLVINVRDNSVAYNAAKFSIIGEQGKGGIQGNLTGVTLHRIGTPGSIIRICEEADGSFPGGGKETVVNPLNFLRRVEIRGINFEAFGADTLYTISAITGRGIENSVIEECGFTSLNYAIRFGTGEENVAVETSTIQGVVLDYCERNLIQRCAFGLTRKHIFITAPDITTITQNFFHGHVENDGTNYVLYWAAGNDYLTFTKNIIHPMILTGAVKIESPIRCYSTRGALFAENHFENTGNKLFNLSIVEDIEIRNNLIYGILPTVDNVIVISAKEYGRVNIHDNIIAHPLVVDTFVKVNAIADDGNNTKLKTINLNYRPNKSTLTLGGATPLTLTSNLDTLFIEQGQCFNPERIARNYIYSDDIGNLKTKPVVDGKPTSNADGAKIWSENYTAFDNYAASNDKQRHILYPLGAQYSSNLADQTGCIVFKHDHITSSLIDADLRVMLENTSTAQSQRNIKCDIKINLTSYLTSGAFTTLGASIQGNGSFFSNKLRVAKDADGKFCIIVGDTTTVWSSSYVRSWIEKLSVGKLGSSNLWDSDWVTTIETDISTYTDVTDLQPKNIMAGYISGTNSVGFGAVPANSQVAYGFTITLNGAAIGDFVMVTPSMSNGLLISAVVTAANLITVYAYNPTAATITPPTLSLRFAVIKI